MAIRFAKTITIGATTIAALAAGAAIHADPSSAAAPRVGAGSCSQVHRLQNAWTSLPAQMQSDIKAARALPVGPDRQEALIAVERKALDGTYGTKVQQEAQTLLAHRGDFAAQPISPVLQADLKHLRSAATRAEKRSDALAILHNAEAGNYGARAQQIADRIQTRLLSCGR